MDTQSLVLLRQDEVCRRVGLSRYWLYRLERQGKFPKRVQVSPNRIGWLEHEINEWISERAAARTKRRVRL